MSLAMHGTRLCFSSHSFIHFGALTPENAWVPCVKDTT